MMDPLRDALRRGDEAKAVSLIISVKEVTHLGMCLLTACETCHPKCAQLLLAAHAAVDQADSNGATPLIAACIKGHGDCVQLLLAAHAAVDQANVDRETPLYAACDKGHSVCAQLLLFSHAAVDQADSNGRTPLIAASDKGHDDCVQVLLAAHAAVDQADSDGCTPLYVACLHGHCDCVQLLLGAHAALDQAEKIGYTPLFAACVEGHDGCAQLLLDASAAVDQTGDHGITPLNVACIKDHGDCAQLLLAANAAIDQADSNGMTPLISACFAGSIDIVKLLVRAGARTDFRSVSGTALELAEARGHTVIARFLRCFLRSSSSSRRVPAAISAIAQVSIAERAAAERAAELAAAALLAEEEAAEGVHKQHAQKKKASQKAKAKHAGANEARALVASASAAASGSADADDEMLAAADDKGVVGSAAANEALRVAMAAAHYESLVGAIEEHHTLASEGVLAEARAMRERLHKKRKQESQKLRRKHAAEMEMLDRVSKQSLLEVTQSPLAAGSSSAEAVPALEAAEALEAPPAAVALTLAELTAATDGFGEQRLIGSGGYGRVFIADALPSLRPEALPPWLRHKPVAVKRAKSGVHDLADLQREVSVLQQCTHPHLLPLLGYYLEHEAPCLVFPLMRGGSFADRLRPKEADPDHLRRLGLSASLSPLMWHQRLHILRQATDALLYLHTPVPGGKGAVVHRDFKPENILLDDELNAFLADTGFAKMDAEPEASKKSASNAFYLTRGSLDPSVVEGGTYSAITDGWALGVTLLVAFTGRSPLSIITKCEEDFDKDFEDIDAIQLADATAGWPPRVATKFKDLVRSAASGLCHGTSVRKRLKVADALATLSSLADEDGSSGAILGTSRGALEGSKAQRPLSPSHQRPSEAIRDHQRPLSPSQPTSTSAGYVPTPLSIQVRETRKGADAHKSIKDNMLLAFSNLMPRLDTVYAARAASAPEGFEDRINYWHREGGMRADLKGQLHSLRIWANAARHGDDERWRREGPRDEAEASQLVSAVTTAIESLEHSK